MGWKWNRGCRRSHAGGTNRQQDKLTGVIGSAICPMEMFTQ